MQEKFPRLSFKHVTIINTFKNLNVIIPSLACNMFKHWLNSTKHFFLVFFCFVFVSKTTIDYMACMFVSQCISNIHLYKCLFPCVYQIYTYIITGLSIQKNVKKIILENYQNLYKNTDFVHLIIIMPATYIMGTSCLYINFSQEEYLSQVLFLSVWDHH